MTKSRFALTTSKSHDFEESSRDYRLNSVLTMSGFYHFMNNSIAIHIERHSFVTM